MSLTELRTCRGFCVRTPRVRKLLTTTRYSRMSPADYRETLINDCADHSLSAYMVFESLRRSTTSINETPSFHPAPSGSQVFAPGTLYSSLLSRSHSAVCSQSHSWWYTFIRSAGSLSPRLLHFSSLIHWPLQSFIIDHLASLFL